MIKDSESAAPPGLTLRAKTIATQVMVERAEVRTAVAFRIAKFLDVSLHHVLTGEALPAGICRHCGWTGEG